MQIVHYPHPVLRQKSVEVQRIDDDLRRTVAGMFELMYAARGVGLAANQVGLPFRFFVVNFSGDPEEKDDEFVFINPVITNRKGTQTDEEGCLSLPGLYADVRRADEVVIEAYDLEGLGYQLSLKEMPARIVQHELDHLDGVMFIDRVADSIRREIDPKVEGYVDRHKTAQREGKLALDPDLEKQVKQLMAAGKIPTPGPLVLPQTTERKD
jgi:peptide deformylase